MNKKLIALAIAAAVAAPMAAQADASVYGKINMGINNYDNGTNSGIVITDEASRLGVKGEEDLGDGLKAIFKMEGTVNMDTGGFNINRDTYFGLKGGFGQVRLGHMNTAYKNSTGKLDVFADTMGDLTGGDFGTFDQRRNNMINYSNKFGPIKLDVDLNQAEATDAAITAGNDKMGNTIAISYSGGPLYVSLATETLAGASNQTDAMKLGVQYKMGETKINFIYETLDSPTANADVTNMNVNADISLGGSNSIGVSYTDSSDDTSTRDWTQMTVGYIHKMSKATKLNIAYSTVSNESASSQSGRIRSGVSMSAPAAGQDVTAFGVNITHNF